jgi:hypothetical protein
MIFDTPAFVGTWTRRSACLIQLLRFMHKDARSTGGHCPGGGYKAHMIQYMAARGSSFARAAFRLAKLGFYDEALSLVRSLGDLAYPDFLTLSARLALTVRIRQ